MPKSSTIPLLFFLFLQSISFAQEWTYFDLSNSGIPSNVIRSVAVDQSNTVWAGTINKGLAKYDQSTWTVYNPDNSPVPSKNIQNIIASESGIWLNCPMDQGTNYLVNFHNNEWQIWKNILNGGETAISNFDIDQDGNIWMVTAGSGGWVIKFDGIEFSAYNSTNSCLPAISPIKYLPTSILCISSEQRWIGYLNNSFSLPNDSGVVLMDQNLCTHFFPNTSDFPTGHQSIKEIHPDPHNNDIWFLSNQEIVRYSNGQWFPIDLGNATTAMAIDDHNGIWVGLAFSGIRYILNGETTNYYGQPDDFVNQLVVDNNDGLWAATDSKGLAYFDISQLNPAAVDEQAHKTIKVYPTLFQDAITIEYKNENPQEAQFFLYSLSGELILKKDLYQHTNIIDLNITSGSTFIYMVSRDQKILKTGKLISSHSR